MKTYVLYNKYSGNNEGLNRAQKVKGKFVNGVTFVILL